MFAERQVFFWLSAALLLVLTIGLLSDILLPFIAGIAIAYFLSPLADRLVALGLSQTWASVVIVGAGTVFLTVALVLLVPLLIAQAEQLATALPGELQRLQVVLETWARQRFGASMPGFEAAIARANSALAENWADLAGMAASSIWSGSLALVNFLALVIVTPIVAFYLLVDWHTMLAKVDSWLPRDHAPTIRAIATDINDATAAFVRGQGTVCLILSVFYAVTLSIAGLDYGLLIGLITGLSTFIPFVGWTLGLVTATIVSLVQYWPDLVGPAIIIAIYLVGHTIDSGYLSPMIVGPKVGLHPVWVIFALFVFGYLFGVVGALLAVPVAAALGVLIRFAIDVYLKSSLYKGSSGQAP